MYKYTQKYVPNFGSLHYFAVINVHQNLRNDNHPYGLVLALFSYYGDARDYVLLDGREELAIFTMSGNHTILEKEFPNV